MNAAPGVAYFTLEGCSRRFFRCEPYRANLSTSSCADRWNAAQNANAEDDRFERCRQCPIGAAHAGRPLVRRSSIFQREFCPRCHRGGARMLGNRLCVSCCNREREFKIGRNGKGTLPQFRFDARRIGAVIDGAYVEIRDDHTADTLELMVQALRVVSGRVMFCRPSGGTAAITSAQLARQHQPAEARRTGTPRGIAAKRSEVFHRTPPAEVTPAPHRKLRPRLPALDRTPNEFRRAPGRLDLRAVRERLLARSAS